MVDCFITLVVSLKDDAPRVRPIRDPWKLFLRGLPREFSRPVNDIHNPYNLSNSSASPPHHGLIFNRSRNDKYIPFYYRTDVGQNPSFECPRCWETTCDLRALQCYHVLCARCTAIHMRGLDKKKCPFCFKDVPNRTYKVRISGKSPS